MLVTKSLVEVWGDAGASLKYRVYRDKDTPLTAWVTGALAEFPAGSAIYVGQHANWDTSWRGFVLYADAGETHYDAVQFDQATPSGTGDTPVDHDTGGADNLAYDYNSVGIEGATVRIYRTSDFAAGTYALLGQTVTDVDGRWATPLYVDAGAPGSPIGYTVTFDKPGVYAVSRKDITV